MWQAAHNLRSSAAATGAYKVSQRCAEIEAIAGKDKKSPSEAVFNALDSELAMAIRALRELTKVNEGVA